MKIYVGYVMNDYSTAVFVGRDKKLVKQKTAEISFGRSYWVSAITLPDKNSICELETD